jgi:hypothetical protein
MRFHSPVGKVGNDNCLPLPVQQHIHSELRRIDNRQ